MLRAAFSPFQPLLLRNPAFHQRLLSLQASIQRPAKPAGQWALFISSTHHETMYVSLITPLVLFFCTSSPEKLVAGVMHFALCKRFVHRLTDLAQPAGSPRSVRGAMALDRDAWQTSREDCAICRTVSRG